MKKTFFLSLALALSTLSLFAQLPSFDFGLKGGVNIAKLSSDFANSDNRLGYQIGVFTRFGAVGFYLQPEAYISGKGGEFQEQSNSGISKYDFTTLDVPILLGNKFGTDKLNLRVMAGPIFSFVLKKDLNENLSNATAINQYKDQTIGAQLGAGVDLGKLTFDVRYEKGLTNIEKSGQYDQKQNLWHLSLGYKIF